MHVISQMTVAAVFAFGLLSSATGHAQNIHGVLRVVKGDVQIKSAKDGKTVKARIGAKVFPQDVISTKKDSRAKIVMIDKNEINISPESEIEIERYDYDPSKGKKDVLLNVIYGKVRSKVEQKYDGKTTKFQIKTPTAVAGVRGTDFITGYNQANRSSSVVTFHGRVEFGLPGPGNTILNPVSVIPGQQASNTAGAPPTAPRAVPRAELVQVEHDSNAETHAAPSALPPADGARTPSADDKPAAPAPAAPPDSGRAPDSAAPPSPGPIASPSMPVDMAPLPPPIPLPPPPMPVAPTVGLPNQCGRICERAIENQNTKVMLKVIAPN